MGVGNIAPGQTPAPGLGSSNQSTTSGSHGGSDSYPDLNNYESGSQWIQEWNTGDADTSGSSDGELCGLQKGKGKGKSGSFNGICYNCGKLVHSANFCHAKGGKAKKGKKRDSKSWKAGKGWSEGKGWNTSGRSRLDVLVMEMSTQEKFVRDSDWCVPVKHVAKLNRMRGSTSTKTNNQFFVDPEEENRNNDTTPEIAWDQNSSPWKTMSVTNAVVVRLMALSGSESEISPHQEAKYTCRQLDRCRHQLLQEGEYGLVRASTKHLGTVAKTSGCRFRSWRNHHASGLVDKRSFDRVRRFKSK